MFFYVASSDSKKLYVHNSPEEFTSQLSQTITTKSCMLGLIDLTLEVSQGIKKESVGDTMCYVMVNECGDAEVRGHKHPIARIISLKEFTNKTKAVLRFPDILYVPIKKNFINTISVAIRSVDSCCSGAQDDDNLDLLGVTRCTFHIKSGCTTL